MISSRPKSKLEVELVEVRTHKLNPMQIVKQSHEKYHYYESTVTVKGRCTACDARVSTCFDAPCSSSPRRPFSSSPCSPALLQRPAWRRDLSARCGTLLRLAHGPTKAAASSASPVSHSGHPSPLLSILLLSPPRPPPQTLIVSPPSLLPPRPSSSPFSSCPASHECDMSPPRAATCANRP